MMKTRIEASEKFLQRWRKEGGRFLSSIITTDETWVNFYDPEMKRESMVGQRHLTNALRKKRPDCEIEDLIFHQDNAPAHRAEDTLLTIDFLGYERLQHPPYSPDLAPMDFCVFPRLKADLRGRRFKSEDEMKFAVRSAIRSYEKEWYADIFEKWVDRHRKCMPVAEAMEVFPRTITFAGQNMV
ncbi:histone-lysine N-methyltransferase SETMAR-like [Mya arenaria]|uniref:histone-lysine N-methyltransferase SETMAR-like n=1 Tax=Mya arenaria TaxID=6604 RepID=UPI0022E38117|nr:histone-lysine N-methyltransferase SETMAR-like [Mya arenaria]